MTASLIVAGIAVAFSFATFAFLTRRMDGSRFEDDPSDQ